MLNRRSTTVNVISEQLHMLGKSGNAAWLAEQSDRSSSFLASIRRVGLEYITLRLSLMQPVVSILVSVPRPSGGQLSTMIVAALQHPAKKASLLICRWRLGNLAGRWSECRHRHQKRTSESLHRYACLGQSKRFEEESSDLAQFLAAWYTMHDSKSNLCKVTSRIFSSYYPALRLRNWLPCGLP